MLIQGVHQAMPSPLCKKEISHSRDKEKSQLRQVVSCRATS